MSPAAIWWYIPKIINFIGWYEQSGFRAYRASRKSYQRYTTTGLAPRSLSATIYYYIIMENTFRFSSLYVFTFFFFNSFFLFPALTSYTIYICLHP